MAEDPPTPAGGQAAEEERRIHLLVWNTFLLRPRLVPWGVPLPAVSEMAAPAVADRAAAIGAALAGTYDVAALAEVFDPIERRWVLNGWDARTGVTALAGPERTFLPLGPAAFASSGLFTVVDGLAVTRSRQHRFTVRGDRLHDADAWSNKGVLLVEVDPLGDDTAGKVEIYSTHLFWGTGLLPGGRSADPERRHHLRMQQVDELVAFVERTHRPENVATVVGDFNVLAHDAEQPGPPGRWHLDLTAKLAPLGLVDTWVARGVGPGPTCGVAEDPFDEEDSECPGRLVDDPGDQGAQPGRERIDYVWVQSATPEHRLELSFGRPRRRAFPRHTGAPGFDRLPRLSDHLALEIELVVRNRPRH